MKRSEELPALEGIKSIPSLNTTDSLIESEQQLINSTWKSVLSIIGANGLPECTVAGNCLRKGTTLTVSIRTPPTMNNKKMLERITEVVSKDVPFGYKVTLERADVANGWNAKALSEGVEKSLNAAVEIAYGTQPIFVGCGGAIPFAGILGEKFPKADFLVTGSSLPDTNAHGPNENLDLPST
eukprot:CAMPEP_0205812714 /NCGR_PEP_ID=MMETSP0205-20121125/17253_1 /ASSEMBLY_ACC=CAM_ASM_000278 /TAXON_ID=36767 /ORGANISM="Euplotes focardii, Strain TN1" /LENGTH=182 /DNA_ID=CAMNT_0053093839 /DNA_START=18 /DNA_END=563 /DNA_ORIENTATION=-